jgi:glutathione S-transferase
MHNNAMESHMIILYEFALSGNCHKVRLLLSLLAIPYESITVNGAEREQKTAAFLALNAFGQVPVLVDGDVVLRDSQAILVYLARQYGSADWLPNEPAALAHVLEWLSVSSNEIARGPNTLRLFHKWGRAVNVSDAEAVTAQLLPALQNRLSASPWLAASHITIADIAAYPYLALAGEGQVDLTPYPAITTWLRKIEALNGYISMPGITEF